MKRLAMCLVCCAACLVTYPVLAADKVVVVPLGGAVGDAVPEDVVRDKTFSTSAGQGLIGTRFPAPSRKTGQTYQGNLNDDVFYNKGIEASPRWTYAQPNPGGIYVVKPGYGYRDNNTGLIWHPDAGQSETGIIAAIAYCEDLETVESLPGYFVVTDWRLPNIVELLSLVNYGASSPALPADHHFTGGNTFSTGYWSSTRYTPNTALQWIVILSTGEAYPMTASLTAHVLCVRD